MDLQWKLRSLGQDKLEHVAVGDPDPTSDHGMDNESRKCQFEWADKVCPTMTLRWCCTRELGHRGQHIAGTGECVAALQAS